MVRRRIGAWNRWTQAAILGMASLASFLAVQWPFADFLMSPASRNWFFATNNMPYFVPPTSHWARNAWFPTEFTPLQFALRMLLALAAGILMTRPRPRLGQLDAPHPSLNFLPFRYFVTFLRHNFFLSATYYKNLISQQANYFAARTKMK